MLARALASGSLAALAASFGCELTAELGAYTDETTAIADTDELDSEATDASDESGTGGGETESAGDGDGDGDGDSGDGDDGDGDGDGDPGDGDGDEGGLCQIDGSESPCQTCLEFLCCGQLENCSVESGCNCMVDCLLESDPVTCAMTCTPGPAYFQLLQCQMISCGAVCE